VTVLASQYNVHKFNNTNADIANEIGDEATGFGTGPNLVFYGGAQEKDDRYFDTFYGHPLTSAWDQVNRWPSTATERGAVDLVASYDNDTRVTQITHCRALTDGQFFLYSDHRLVEVGYYVWPV